jgi:hypothetical protein
VNKGFWRSQFFRKPPVLKLLTSKGPILPRGKTGFFQKGFWFSMDAILAFLVLTILLLSFSQPKKSDFSGLAVLQKQHDLFKVWQQANETNIEEMKKDVEMVFPQHAFELKVGNRAVQQQKTGWQPNASAAETMIWTGAGTVSVFLNVHY